MKLSAGELILNEKRGSDNMLRRIGEEALRFLGSNELMVIFPWSLFIPFGRDWTRDGGLT